MYSALSCHDRPWSALDWADLEMRNPARAAVSLCCPAQACADNLHTWNRAVSVYREQQPNLADVGLRGDFRPASPPSRREPIRGRDGEGPYGGVRFVGASMLSMPMPAFEKQSKEIKPHGPW